MCLAIPGKVISRNGTEGIVDFGGVRKQVSFECLPEAALGDYVLVHVGIVLSIIDEQEAQRALEFLQEMDELGELR